MIAVDEWTTVLPSRGRREYLTVKRGVCEITLRDMDREQLQPRFELAVLRLVIRDCVPEVATVPIDTTDWLRDALEREIRTKRLAGATLADVIAECDRELEAVR